MRGPHISLLSLPHDSLTEWSPPMSPVPCSRAVAFPYWRHLWRSMHFSNFFPPCLDRQSYVQSVARKSFGGNSRSRNNYDCFENSSTIKKFHFVFEEKKSRTTHSAVTMGHKYVATGLVDIRQLDCSLYTKVGFVWSRIGSLKNSSKPSSSKRLK